MFKNVVTSGWGRVISPGMEAFKRNFGLVFGLTQMVAAKPYRTFVGVYLIAVFFLRAIAMSIHMGMFLWPWEVSVPRTWLLTVSVPTYFNAARGSGGPEVRMVVTAIGCLLIWLALSMAARRLIALGRNPLWSFLVFFPVIREIFLLILAVPGTSVVEKTNQRHTESAFLPLKIVGLSAFVTVASGLAGVLLGVFSFGVYGIALYVITPFAMGVYSAYTVNRRYPLTARANAKMALISIVAMGGLLWITLIEGLMCIIMAFPIGLALCLLGSALGRHLALQPKQGEAARVLVPLPLLFLATASLETRMPPPPVLHVSSETVINAPVDKVWQSLVALDSIPAPTEWYFKAGIAYPVGARLDGQGVGATRHCLFSTGDMVERITDWNPGKGFKFEILTQPAPMVEMSYADNIHPPHLDGYLRSLTGEFRLTAISPTQTRLEGLSEYEMKIYPTYYWRFISDWLYSAIHQRVFRQIKTMAEGNS